MNAIRSRPLATLVAAAVLSMSSFLAPTSATAAPGDQPGDLQRRVDAVLEDFPGGVQTAPNEITWGSGETILTLTSDETATAASRGDTLSRSVGSCSTGYYCAFSGNNLSGSKLSFSLCNTTHSTAALGGVRSIANARSFGTVYGKNSSGTVLATVGSGGSEPYASASITQLSCVD